MKCSSETGIACSGLPVSEVGLAGPAAALDHRLEDHLGGERPLLRRVVVRDLRLLDGIVGGQADHPPAGRVQVDRLSARDPRCR